MQLTEPSALLVDPGRVLACEERSAGNEHLHLGRAPSGMRIAEYKGTLRAVEGGGRSLDIDPQLVECGTQRVERNDTAQFREQRGEAAVVALGP